MDFNGLGIMYVRFFSMFKKTNPQKKLFGIETQISESARKRLKTTWAGVFRTEILPVLMNSESGFAILYGDTGRPNFSVGRMLGLCLLQELNNLPDDAALESFQFDRRWQYALDIGTDEDPYLSRRSLVEFRRRLALKDPNMELMRGIFERISNAAIGKLGISYCEQRLDSTHIASNIHTKSRIDLFQKTIRHFLMSLGKEQLEQVPARIRRWFEEEPKGWFGLGSASKNRKKLKQLADYIYKLVRKFAEDKAVVGCEPYQLLTRLLEEQCEVEDENRPSPEDGPQTPAGPGTDDDEPVPVTVKKKPKGTLLDSPYDPDASYGYKGTGYSVHITETCNNKGKHEIITDYEVHGAARSDIGKASGVLERVEVAGLKPQALFVDAGYPSVPDCYGIFSHGVEVVGPVNRVRLDKAVMGRDRFQFDGDGLVEVCPEGHKAIDHRKISNSNSKGVKVLHAIFSGDKCRKCAKLELCPVRAPNHRTRGCKPRDTVGDFRLEVTPAIRLRDEMWITQQKDDWKMRYKIRPRGEATQSELKRAHGLGKLRVRRKPKVIFAVVCKVTACNIKRWAKALFTCLLVRRILDDHAPMSEPWASLVRLNNLKDLCGLET